MKTNPFTLGLLLVMTAATPLGAQVSAFTYQGRLNLNGTLANGYYDFMFRLLNDPTNAVAAPVIPINVAVPVSNGLFTTRMDFGAENFDGANRWLEINVRTNGGGPFTTLSPRQLLTPTPYAIAAHTASNLLGALPASQISGTILNAMLPASPSFSGTVTANTFFGSGANLTNVNAATLGGLNSSNFWRTTGNAGTTAGAHFLGTTDDQPLDFKAGNLRGLRLDPHPGTLTMNIIAGAPVNGVAVGVTGATIAGGGSGNYQGFLTYSNHVGGEFGTVSGGARNRSYDWATVGGGLGNSSFGNCSCVDGGFENTAWGGYSTVGGGYQNISFESASLGGGYQNVAGGVYSTVSGGIKNTNWSQWSVISGGEWNLIGSAVSGSFIGGGSLNTIQAYSSAIVGGSGNTVQHGGNSSTIGGGYYNEILTNASYATIPGGRQNSATNYAFAAGFRAKANHAGAFVWADASLPDDFQHELASANPNSVTMRASGGYRLFADVNATTGVFLEAGSGSWTSMSDRNAKENFRATDTREILEKVIAVPVQTWNYKSQDAGIRHIGPMAQDFKAAFGVGETDTGIATVDADGVALAAIQGLNQKLEEIRVENAELKKRLTELERVVRKPGHAEAQR